MENLIVRKMKENDYLSVHKNLFPLMEIEDVKNNVFNNVKMMQQENLNWEYFVAEQNKEIIGITYLKYSDSIVQSHIAELVSIVIAEEYRGKGVFKNIFKYIIKYLKEKQILKVVLSVRKRCIAETVYQKLGFIKYGELPKGIKDTTGFIDQVNYYYDIEKES